MSVINDLLCLLEGLIGLIFGLLNATVGSIFGFQLIVPGLGCPS